MPPINDGKSNLRHGTGGFGVVTGEAVVVVGAGVDVVVGTAVVVVGLVVVFSVVVAGVVVVGTVVVEAVVVVVTFADGVVVGGGLGGTAVVFVGIGAGIGSVGLASSTFLTSKIDQTKKNGSI